jgi:hypothetical protein
MTEWSKKLYGWNRYLQDWQEDQNRWGNDKIEDLRNMKINNWTKCIQDRVKWKGVFEKAKTFKL